MVTAGTLQPGLSLRAWSQGAILVCDPSMFAYFPDNLFRRRFFIFQSRCSSFDARRIVQVKDIVLVSRLPERSRIVQQLPGSVSEFKHWR
jgi:hypothetical protein